MDMTDKEKDPTQGTPNSESEILREDEYDEVVGSEPLLHAADEEVPESESETI